MIGLIGGIAVVVAAVLVVVFVVVPRSGGGATPPAAVSSHPPAGQPDDEPGVLLRQQVGTGPAVSVNQTPVFNACDVLPLRVVEAAGIRMDPQYTVFDFGADHDTTVTQSTFGAFIYTGGQAGTGISNCDYPGLDQKDLISPALYQAPQDVAQTSQQFLQYAADEGGSHRTEGGYAVWTVPNKTDANSWQVGIIGKQNWVNLVIGLNGGSYHGHTPQQVLDGFVSTIVTNLAKGPTAPATYSYAKPYAGVTDPCVLFTNDEFRSLTAADSLLVNRTLQFGEREVDPDAGVGLSDAHYIVTGCERNTLSSITENYQSDGPGFGLKVDFDVYRSVDEAKTGEYVECDPRSSAAKVFGPSIQEDVKIGDGRVCYPNEGGRQWRLVFRSGRTVVFLSDIAVTTTGPLDQQARAFVPVGQRIAAAVAKM
ncbi:MAG TPA: hypothetical protein VH333_24320 [Pseudonocardiaceae bacterium]|jgi:hypothetical protein|nr:hypothetical protein [Pseudonocardiaceae bacterium]